jgi:hypothetical protein
MLCYRDRTYCRFYKTCIFGLECPRALTPKVSECANKSGLYIMQYGSKPKCYKETK